jgi:cell division cycle protein 20 (cofactor of APC complex)
MNRQDMLNSPSRRSASDANTPTQLSMAALIKSPSGSRASQRHSASFMAGDSPMRSPMMPPESPMKRTPERVLSDRFIPEVQDADLSRFVLESPNQENNTPPSLHGSPSAAPGHGEPYHSMLSRSLFGDDARPSVLGFHRPRHGEASETERFNQAVGVVYSENRARNFKSRTFRVIPQTPERILDAPDLLDDFYLNLIDWSSTNVLSVALGNTCYLWNAESGDIQQLMKTDDAENIISGVSWNHDGSLLAIGLHDYEVQIWDAAAQRVVRRYRDHEGRIGSLSWNGNVLATGSRDSAIRLYDARQKECLMTYQGHSQEVCGLRWDPTGRLLASGGNDNLLNVWDMHRQAIDTKPLFTFRAHTAAVKAIAWNPVQKHVLASGGGTADKTLRFWNTETGELANTIDTKSQVCGALWSRSGTELITSHGYSDNQLTIWKYPSLRRVVDLTGHGSRVLHLSMSPDGQMVVSAAGDETIRFWRCFGGDVASPPVKVQRGAKTLRSADRVPMDDLDGEALR